LIFLTDPQVFLTSVLLSVALHVDLMRKTMKYLLEVSCSKPGLKMCHAFDFKPTKTSRFNFQTFDVLAF